MGGPILSWDHPVIIPTCVITPHFSIYLEWWRLLEIFSMENKHHDHLKYQVIRVSVSFSCSECFRLTMKLCRKFKWISLSFNKINNAKLSQNGGTKKTRSHFLYKSLEKNRNVLQKELMMNINNMRRCDDVDQSAWKMKWTRAPVHQFDAWQLTEVQQHCTSKVGILCSSEQLLEPSWTLYWLASHIPFKNIAFKCTQWNIEIRVIRFEVDLCTRLTVSIFRARKLRI